MTKTNADHFCAYLNVLGGTINYRETSRIMGDDESLIFKWLQKSKVASATPDVPSVFLFEYQDAVKWLHEHVRTQISTSVDAIEAAARGRALHGTFNVAMFQGRTVFKRDPNLTADIIEMLGLPDDLLRDEHGQPIPETVWTPPSTDLVAMILQAHSKKYRKQSQLSIDMRARVSGGVMVVGNKQLAAPALPMVEILEAIEPERPLVDAHEADLEDLLGPEPEPALKVSDTDPEPEPDIAADEVSLAEPEERVIRAPTPPEYQPVPNALITPPKAGVPASWRAEWDQLVARTVPDKVDRRS